MAIEELTKKEQIINFAQSDPFLKISDIAENVQTTPRYVRTILSEANISLMKLREKYARNMEKRLKSNREVQLQAKVSLKNNYSFNQLKVGKIKVEKIKNEDKYLDIKKINENDELIKIYQLKFIDENPYILHKLITYMEKDINGQRIKNLNSIYDLLGRKGINRLQFMDNVISVILPDKNLSKYFDKEDNLIKIERKVLLNKISIGIEKMYLQSKYIEILFPGEIIT